VPYSQTTLAELQTLLVQRWDTVVFWTPEEARLALNEALCEWNLLTGRWRTPVALDVTAHTPEIALPGVLTYAMRVTTAAGAPLHPTSIFELDFALPQWRLSTAATPELWAPVSLTQIAIWPASPIDAAAALRGDGVMTTPVLVAPTDRVDLGEEIIDVICDMALHIAAFKEAGDRWRATRPYFEAFLQAAADENALLKTNQAYRRWAGLDRRRDLQPSTGAPNQLQAVVAQFSRHDQAEQE
jgi:hypothetical protein